MGDSDAASDCGGESAVAVGDAASDCGESAAAVGDAAGDCGESCCALTKMRSKFPVVRRLPGIEFSDRSPRCRSLHTQDAQMALLLVRDTTIVGESPSYRTAS